MSKNKLAWIFALVLIFTIALPIAHAQVIPTGSRLSFILINAAIIFVVLFVLQAFLVQGKGDKEKTSMWIILVLASLLLAYLFGQTGYLWAEGQPLARFFSIPVLVNAVIIAAVLYFVLGWMKVGNLNSPEGKTGYGILIFLVALIFAVQLGNKFIWQQDTIKELINFFFGNEGILTTSKNRIYIFISTSVLFVWFFNFVGLGKENKGINWALAIIFAANLASGPDPLTITGVKKLVLVIGTWILGSNLSGNFTGKLKTKDGYDYGFILGYVIAFLLVLWAISAVETATTPEGKAAVAGKGIFGGFFSMFWGNKGLIALFVIVLLIMLAILRGETRRRILTLGLGELKEIWNAIIKNAKYLRDTPEGREPQVFRENSVLLHALVNFTTRSEITYRYWGFVEQGKRVGADILKTKVRQFQDQTLLRKDIIAARSGGITSDGTHLKGWNRLNVKAVDLLNEFFELTYWVHVAAEFNFKDRTAGNFKNEKSIYETKFIQLARDIDLEMEASRKNYELYTSAFGGHHVLNAYKGIILNMTNVTGDILEHPQKFARPGAVFIGNNNKLRDDRSEYYGNSFEAGHKIDVKGLKVPIHEVNQYGEYIQDIVDQKNASGDLRPDPRDYKKPRKVKPNDIIDYPDYSALMSNIELDWQGLAEDIRYGIWHPHSRTYQMYKKALAKAVYPDWADDQIPIDKILTPPVSGDEAVDLRALANPGKHDYWGRITFDAEQPPKKDDPKHNPFPGLSALGIKKYMQERVRLDVKDKAKAAYFMSTIPADTAATKKIVKGEKVEVPIGGRLSEGVEEASKQQ